LQLCNYHIHSLRHIRPLIDCDVATVIACAIVSSRIDYCNSVIYGVTEAKITGLQRIQNQLAQVVCKAPYQSSATDLLRQLHWLPVTQRIDCKILTTVYSVKQHGQHKYLLDLLIDYAPTPQVVIQLKPANRTPSDVKTATASHAFQAAAPKLWNNLPSFVKSSCTYDVFKHRLKSYFFAQVFT